MIIAVHQNFTYFYSKPLPTIPSWFVYFFSMPDFGPLILNILINPTFFKLLGGLIIFFKSVPHFFSMLLKKFFFKNEVNKRMVFPALDIRGVLPEDHLHSPTLPRLSRDQAVSKVPAGEWSTAQPTSYDTGQSYKQNCPCVTWEGHVPSQPC